jgi:hypothetical protein
MVVQPGHPLSHEFPLPPITELNVLSWNLFMRPAAIYFDAQNDRAAKVADTLFSIIPEDELDVIAFEGLYDDRVRAMIIQSFATRVSGWRNFAQSYVQTVRLNGGVVIMSRWPIDRQTVLAFNCSILPDSSYLKGVTYARIIKVQNGRAKHFHTFATDFQSTSSNSRSELTRIIRTRDCQANAMSAFISSLEIRSNEPVIMLGTFGVDFLNNIQLFSSEINTVLKILEVEMPLLGGPMFSTYDSSRHELAGRSGVAELFGCGPECDMMRNCSCVPPMWLDYIFFHQNHQHPVNVSALYTLDIRLTPPLETEISQSDDPLAPLKMVKRSISYLSNHDPIIRTFKFLH